MGLKTVAGIMKNRTAAREKAPIGRVADERIDAVLPIVSNQVADICRLMRLTGMRPGEVLAMTAAEIDRTDPSCSVYRPGHHKTEHKDKTRVVFIGERGQQILLPRILKAGEGPLFPMTRGIAASDSPRLRASLSSSGRFQDLRQEADRGPESRVTGLAQIAPLAPQSDQAHRSDRGTGKVRARGGAMPLGSQQNRVNQV
jgi:integrase